MKKVLMRDVNGNLHSTRDEDGRMDKINAGLIMLAEMREKLPPSEKR